MRVVPLETRAHLVCVQRGKNVHEPLLVRRSEHDVFLDVLYVVLDSSMSVR